jgi:undecaprenyl-phosphate galactose phosphotransferase
MKPVDSIFAPQTRWFCRRRAEKALLVGTDVLSMALAFVLAVVLSARVHGHPVGSSAAWSPVIQSVHPSLYGCLAVLAVGLFWSHGHYSKRKPFVSDVKDILRFSAVIAALDLAMLYLSKSQFSRANILFNWAALPCMLVGMRWLAKRGLMAAGGWVRPMVIVGWGDNAVETALAFQDESMMGLRLAAFVVPAGQERFAHAVKDHHGHLVPTLFLGPDPVQTVRQLGNPHVVLALEHGGMDSHRPLILQLSRHQHDVQLVPPLRGLPLYGMEANHFFAHEVLVLTMRNNLARRLPRLVKRCFDLVVSASLLVLAAPLFAYIACTIRLAGGPAFFGHVRVGRGRAPFPCYKFRTMAPDADRLLDDLLQRDPQARAEWERDRKLQHDPRVTPIGRFLRRTSLDELPQLWNVLKGDMSLVGPRPVVTAELERYGDQLGYYLDARPGITGLWQISGRSGTSYDRRVHLDAWYVKNWSLFNDVVILLRTVKVIFRKDGAY